MFLNEKIVAIHQYFEEDLERAGEAIDNAGYMECSGANKRYGDALQIFEVWKSLREELGL